MSNISLIGFDLHRIKRLKRKGFLKILYKKNKIGGLYIGGVLVDKEHIFMAHSDGDILIHAIIDAIAPYTLGKDIGQLFPDSDIMYKNYSSISLLENTLNKINGRYKVKSIDGVIVIDKIKISIIKEKIIDNLKSYFPDAIINIKGKRTEGGFNKNYGYCWVTCTIES